MTMPAVVLTAHGRIALQDRLALRTGHAALEPILTSDQRELLGGFESDE
jgi:hypothetical protein